MSLNASLSVPYGGHARQRVDVMIPDGASSALVCCVSGGGGSGWWADGRCEIGRGFALLLAEHGVPVATLGHRALGDGVRTGDELLADLAEAAAKAAEEAGVLGWNGRSLALLGHGSGALAALLLIPRLARRHPVRAAVACGVLATTEPGHGTAAAHQAACDRFAMGRHRDHAPLHLDPALIPPLLLLHGEQDREVPAEQARALHQHLTAAGETCVLEVLPEAGHRFAEDAAGPMARPRPRKRRRRAHLRRQVLTAAGLAGRSAQRPTGVCGAAARIPVDARRAASLCSQGEPAPISHHPRADAGGGAPATDGVQHERHPDHRRPLRDL
jgi:alpha-beta hydrolase superfamily lysophospholipase